MLYPEENIEPQQDRCPMCGKPVAYGRVDRRFCSITCKNRWHNLHRHPEREKESARVLRILGQNQEVLEKLLKMGMRNVDKLTLVHLGFNPNYFTSLQRHRNRWIYTCLDIRYEMTPTRLRNISFLWEGAYMDD